MVPNTCMKVGVKMPGDGKKKRFKWLIILLVFIVIIISAGVFAYSYYNDSIYKPMAGLKAPEKVEVNIETGTSSAQITQQLYEAGLIKNMDTFKIYLKLSNLGDKIQAGKYEMNTGMNAAEIVDKMVKGDVLKDTVIVTIPEGYTVKDIAAKFEEAKLTSSDEFMKAEENDSFDYGFLKNLPKRPVRLEGYLFPDTYEFSKDVTAHQIIDRMLSRFNEIMNNDMIAKAKDLNLTIDQAVTVASMIEKEAKIPSERPTIASVIYNRLKKKMLLQIDATVQYAQGQWKDKLLTQDTQIDSPYNTYKYAGLPVGPISNPGKASLEAAMNPDKTDYLFYVLKKDGNGAHVFTKTYAEHLKEIAKNKTN